MDSSDSNAQADGTQCGPGDTSKAESPALPHGSMDLATLFQEHRPRLRRMLEFRMSPQLRGRIDPSDVLQETFLELSRRLPEYQKQPSGMPFFVWLRRMTIERLIVQQRRHIGAKQRDARRDRSLEYVASDDSGSRIAMQLIENLSSVDRQLIRKEEVQKIHDAISELDAVDREIISLRLFESLTNQETAKVLELPTSTTSRRFILAIESLRQKVETLSRIGYPRGKSS
ncbi:MAG: sigma-70 family RNA polymerase sigma factor [Planctomycetota bacterium]